MEPIGSDSTLVSPHSAYTGQCADLQTTVIDLFEAMGTTGRLCSHFYSINLADQEVYYYPETG